MSQTGYMSSLLPAVLEKQITKIKKIVRALNKYHRRQYYSVNIFKFLLPESKVYLSFHTFCHPCYCHPCYQPKVAGMTSGYRDDTNMFSLVIWIVFRIINCYYIFSKQKL